MKILAFDTCFGACSAALVQRHDSESTILASEDRELTRGHAEVLLPMVERILDEANVRLDRIDRLAVTNGPGTFAGARVGIATARALALATSKPVVSVGTLEAIAQTAFAKHDLLPENIAIVRDARRGQVFAQSFKRTAQGIKATMPDPVVCRPEQVLNHLPGVVDLAIGSGVDLVPWGNAKHPECWPGDIEVSAVSVATLAAGRKPDTRPVSPLYLRPPDAKPQSGFALERQC